METALRPFLKKRAFGRGACRAARPGAVRRTERRRVRPKNAGASRARIPQTNAEKKGSLVMNAMIYKKKGPLVLFLVPTFLFLTM